MCPDCERSILFTFQGGALREASPCKSCGSLWVLNKSRMNEVEGGYYFLLSALSNIGVSLFKDYEYYSCVEMGLKATARNYEEFLNYVEARKAADKGVIPVFEQILKASIFGNGIPEDDFTAEYSYSL